MRVENNQPRNTGSNKKPAIFAGFFIVSTTVQLMLCAIKLRVIALGNRRFLLMLFPLFA